MDLQMIYNSLCLSFTNEAQSFVVLQVLSCLLVCDTKLILLMHQDFEEACFWQYGIMPKMNVTWEDFMDVLDCLKLDVLSFSNGRRLAVISDLCPLRTKTTDLLLILMVTQWPKQRTVLLEGYLVKEWNMVWPV